MSTEIPPVLLWGAVLPLAVVASVLFARLLARVLAAGGKAPAVPARPPEIGVAAGLVALLLHSAIHALTTPSQPIDATQLAAGACTYALFGGGVFALLHFREPGVLRRFRLHRPAWALLPAAAGLGVACVAPTLLCATLVERFFAPGAEPQSIVQFFAGAVARRDFAAIALTIGVAVVVAPVTEEVLFRGFLHGLLKRPAGTLPALVFNAALFAVVHGSQPAIAPLFLLGLLFGIAYEFTGSLLVPIVMHVIFNAAMIAWMFAATP
jgi:membrane protease YdiL (CAAX protease family)